VRRLPTVALLAAALAGLLVPLAAQAKSPAGTSIAATVTTAGSLTGTFAWTLAKSADPASQMVAVGASATVHWTITASRGGGSGTLGATLAGSVCVTDQGGQATQVLAISDSVSEPPSASVLDTVSVDLSGKPQLLPGETHCYPYQVTIPAAAITTGATYKDSAHVTITNQAGHPGSPSGPSPSASAALPTSPTPLGITVTDSNSGGQTFSFSDTGSQSYDQTVACPTADGAQTISDSNTATITSTGQQAQATATVHCGAATTTSTTLSATSIATGGSATDQASISGLQPGAAGTISYAVYDNADCSGTPIADATPTSNTISNGTIPASKAIEFDTAGSYYWQASYSGDPDHNTLPSSSSCADEKLTVTSTCPNDGTTGCPWQNNDLTTYNQAEWGGTASPAALLLNYYNSVYQSVSLLFAIGDPRVYFEEFDSAAALHTYLPQSGTVGELNATLLDPTSSSAGAFGGDVAALKLNVDFSDAGVLSGNSGLKFGDLTICGLTSDTGLNGTTIRNFVATANSVLGAASTAYTPTALDALAQDLNASFDAGTPSTWAQQHLENGACGWHDGDVLTYVQAAWGTGSAVSLLSDNFNTVYAPSDLFVIGDTSKYTEEFDSASAVEGYLPQTGSPNALNASLLDPTISASGSFGGDVAGLKLNIDFSDAGLVTGNSGLKFGDLTVCGLTSDTGLNGTTVRGFLTTANAVLGAASTAYTASDLDTIASDLNASFGGGTPSSWAQDHLVDGSCP
jgi:hypothetical protein